MKRLALMMTVVSSLFLFSACGQSGALYVPGSPSQMAVPPSQPADEDSEQESGDDSSETD